MAALVLVVALIGVIGVFVSGGFTPFLPSNTAPTTPTAIVEQVEKELAAVVASSTARTTEALYGVSVGTENDTSETRDEFPIRYPMIIGTVAVEASVATSVADRVKGLSGTTALPPRVVKLFVFASDGPQNIWMKDMLYPIDIMWLNAQGEVVHIETAIAPSTYPSSFSSPLDARYVIETVAGFAAEHGITIGTVARLPLLQ